ncbi:Cytochrome P450 monooxygenase apf7 [Lachnellula suecica]|uniref:Cytochrome P450 monooxygenase apf7 n=1 Tax=Lachnellula suecica TaxID=602035 RepID=A0A8T9BWQ1_9HELO|nr:Cytochrome P450 monooxygenase apf7 [Lachnellula suecica]
MDSSLFVFLVLSSSILCYIIASAFYNHYFHPLSKHPGPLLCSVSTLPNFYHTIKGDRHLWIWSCHQEYGNIIRFVPNGILLNTPTAYRSIYNSKANVQKPNTYVAASRDSKHTSTMNTIHPATHSRKRRVLNSVFFDKAVRSAEAFIVEHVDRWCEILLDGSSDGWTTPKNFATPSSYLAFDIMGTLSFGKSFDLKEPNDSPFRAMLDIIPGFMAFFHALAQSPVLDIWVWLKPRGLDTVLEYLSPPAVKKIYDFNDTNIKTRIALLQKQKDSGAEAPEKQRDMLYYLFEAKDLETGEPAYSDRELYAEVELLVLAGSDTVAMTLASFIFHVLHNPRVYDKVTEEIRNTFKSMDDIRGGPALASCQYFRACVDETLRMTPVVPSELPREVLAGGCTIDGHHFEKGTKLGTSHWTLMHNEAFFDDAWDFRPERWIVDEGNSSDKVALARSAFFPFSYGPASCVGQKLAMQEILIAIGRVLYRMDLRLAPGSCLGVGNPNLYPAAKGNVVYHARDVYLSQVDGPSVQFKKKDEAE